LEQGSGTLLQSIDHAWHLKFLAYLRNRLRDETINKIKLNILSYWK
jgi:hypothetical protein